MIQINNLDTSSAKSLYEAYDIPFNENCFATAYETDNSTPFILYSIEGDVMHVLYICTFEDNANKALGIADNLLRSALFVAANRGIFIVKRGEKVSGEVICKLGFSDNSNDDNIDITHLFSCECGD